MNDTMSLGQLAAYLCRDARDLDRLAARNKIPGRKAGGRHGGSPSVTTKGTHFMLRICFAVAAVAVLFLNGGATGAEDAMLPVQVAASSPKVHYVGRFDTGDAKGPRCAWSACAVSLRFKGTAVQVKLDESGGAAIGLAGVNQYQVVVDGKPTSVLIPAKGEGVYTPLL